jgi:enoyl-CoA hydratase/carnithine racemase
MELETVNLTFGDDGTPAAGVATITLNRPERKNAINGQMWSDLKTVLRSIVDEDRVRVVVLTGAGGEFCSGADLGAKGGVGDAERRHQLLSMREVSEVALALHRLPMPTIAKVNGVAVGAGCNMALGCDLVVASDRSRFSEIFAKRGLAVDFGGSWILPRLIGLHKAKELAFFADIISAHDAYELGIVNRVLPVDQLDGFVDDWATRLAAGPPLAYRLTKKLLNEGSLLTMDQALEAEGWTQTVTIGSSADTTEAMRAFVEKRTPVFKGR